MPRNLIPATALSEFVFCAKAWELKYIRGPELSSVELHDFMPGDRETAFGEAFVLVITNQ